MTLQRARHVATLAALSLALSATSIFLGASTAHAANTWREGWCKEGEGQSVVLDWGTHPDDATPIVRNPDGHPYLVRCLIFADKDNPAYDSQEDPRIAVFEDVGLTAESDGGGLVSVINGIDADELGEWWSYAGTNSVDKAWDMGLWGPEPSKPFHITSLSKDMLSGHYSVEPQYAEDTNPGPDPSAPGEDPSEPGEDPSTPDPDPSEPGDDPSTPDPSPSSPSGNPSTPDPTRSGTPSAGPSTPKDTPSKQAPTPAPPTQRPTNSVERPDDQGRRNTAVRPNLPTGPNQGRPAQRPLPRLTISSIPQPSLTPSASASASPSPTPTPSSSASMTPSPSGTPLVAAASPSEQAVWGEEHPQRETEEAATANSNAVAWTLGILGVLAAAGIAAFFLVRRKSSGEESQV